MNAPMRRRAVAAGAACAMTAATLSVATGAEPAAAVNADHGDRVVSPEPADTTPHVMNGAVYAITQVGDTVIAAGTFTSVSPADTYGDTSDDLVRNRMFAFDATTGSIIRSFNPNLGGAVNSLDTDGAYIYAGGRFGSVGGNTAIKRLVKLDLSGRPVRGFKAVPNDAVNEVVVRGSRLYVGGRFTSIRSGPVRSQRGALAALRTSTGSVFADLDLPFTGVYNPDGQNPGSTSITGFDVTADGSRLVAVGNFSRVDGRSRVQIAMLNTGGLTATVAPWATNRFDRAHNPHKDGFETFMRDVDFSPDGRYFVVSTTGGFAGGAAGGTMRDTTSRWETAGTGNDPTWRTYTGGDTTYGVAVTGSAVYVGGHMRWENNPFQGNQAGPGAVPRRGIAALDPLNGLPLSWDPGRTRGVGAQALFATEQGLWVGSDTDRISGELRGKIALMPLAGGPTVSSASQTRLPADLFIAPASDGAPTALLVRTLDASGTPEDSVKAVDQTLNWNTLRGAFLAGGLLYYGSDDGNLYKRTFNPTTHGVGDETEVNLYDDPDDGTPIPFQVARLTGMFFDPATHRLYYAVSGDSRLHYRYFTPESGIVGAQTFSAGANGLDASSIAGMALAGGRIFYGSSLDGDLRSVPFAGGRITGTPHKVSDDGSWEARAMFAVEGPPQVQASATITVRNVTARATATRSANARVVRARITRRAVKRHHHHRYVARATVRITKVGTARRAATSTAIATATRTATATCIGDTVEQARSCAEQKAEDSARRRAESAAHAVAGARARIAAARAALGRAEAAAHRKAAHARVTAVQRHRAATKAKRLALRKVRHKIRGT